MRSQGADKKNSPRQKNTPDIACMTLSTAQKSSSFEKWKNFFYISII